MNFNNLCIDPGRLEIRFRTFPLQRFACLKHDFLLYLTLAKYEDFMFYVVARDDFNAEKKAIL